MGALPKTSLEYGRTTVLLAAVKESYPAARYRIARYRVARRSIFLGFSVFFCDFAVAVYAHSSGFPRFYVVRVVYPFFASFWFFRVFA